MGFLRQGHWSGLPFTSPGDLLDPNIEPGSPALQVGSLPSEPPGLYFPNFPYKKFQVKLPRLKHMIWYETQQSQCSWGPRWREGAEWTFWPRSQDWEWERERERERESVCVCVCVSECSVCSVCVFSFWAWNRLKYILKKKAEVLCEYWSGKILSEPLWRSGFQNLCDSGRNEAGPQAGLPSRSLWLACSTLCSGCWRCQCTAWRWSWTALWNCPRLPETGPRWTSEY